MQNSSGLSHTLAERRKPNGWLTSQPSARVLNSAPGLIRSDRLPQCTESESVGFCLEPASLRHSVNLLLFLLVIVHGGCSGLNSDPIQLTLSTGSQAGTYHPMGEAIAAAVNAAHPDLSVRVIESAGSFENWERLCAGVADLGMIQNDAEPDGRIRCLLPLHTELFHFFASTSSDINRVRDLIGKRVMIGAEDSGTRRLALMLLRHYEVSLEQLTVIEESPDRAIALMEDGELDALFHVGDIKSTLSKQLLQTDIARLVSFGEDAGWNNDIRALEVSYPFLERATIPRNLYVTNQGKGKPEAAVHTFGLRSMLVCRSDLPYDVAKQVVSAVFTNRAQVMQSCPAARQITEQFDRDQLHFPLHPGAAAYYDRYEPSFLERYAETIALMLTLAAGGWALLVAASNAMRLKKKNRIDKYYVRLSEISEQLSSTELTVETVDQLDTELNRLRAQAIDELTREKLKADDSFRIFQSLLSDCQRQALARRSLLL